MNLYPEEANSPLGLCRGFLRHLKARGYIKTPLDAKNKYLDSDGDRMEDYKEKNPTKYYSEFTKYMTPSKIEAQFNHLMRDHIQPVILKPSVDHKSNKEYRVTVGKWVIVKCTVIDPTGVQLVGIGLKGKRMSYLNPEKNETGAYPMTYLAESPRHSMEVSVRTYNTGEYTIIIKAADGAGNIGVLEHVQKSWLKSAYDGFLDAMGEAWEAAKNAANWFKDRLLEWLKGVINTIWSVALEPLVKLARGYVSGIIECLSDFNQEFNDFDWDGSTTRPNGFDIAIETNEVFEAGLAFLLSFLGLQNVADELMDTFTKIQQVIEPYQDLLNPAALFQVLLGKLPGLSGALSKVQSAAVGATRTTVNLLMDIIFFNGNSVFSLVGLSGKELFENVPSYNAIANFISFSGLVTQDSISQMVINKIDDELSIERTRGSSDGWCSWCCSAAVIVGLVLLPIFNRLGILTWTKGVGFQSPSFESPSASSPKEAIAKTGKISNFASGLMQLFDDFFSAAGLVLCLLSLGSGDGKIDEGGLNINGINEGSFFLGVFSSILGLLFGALRAFIPAFTSPGEWEWILTGISLGSVILTATQYS